MRLTYLRRVRARKTDLWYCSQMKIPGLDTLVEELTGRGDDMQKSLDSIEALLVSLEALLVQVEKNTRPKDYSLSYGEGVDTDQ